IYTHPPVIEYFGVKHGVLQMQETGGAHRGSQRVFSVLDRLLLTHPVWLQLSLNRDSALYALLREPVGTFLVRKCSSSQRKVLCLRVTADKSGCPHTFTRAMHPMSLSRDLLPHTRPQGFILIFFLVGRDVLPFPLQLPEAIAKATTHRQLEAISHMGQGTVERLSCKYRHSCPPTSLNVEAAPRARQSIRAEDQGIEVAVLSLERRPAPSLAELDSCSSFSSMDEDDEDDSDSDPESAAQARAHFYPRPPLVRSRGRGGLHRMSEAFVCFFAPDKRLTRLVEELSRDRRSIFGGMVQDFLLAQREVLKSLASSSSSSSSSSRVTSVQLLQGLRLFLSQAKYLALERAMFSCVLRPLRSHLEKALMASHNQDGSSQRLTQNLIRLKGDAAMERLGVRTGVPDGREVERVKQKLLLMQRTHSPIDKVLLLLQVCKCVHKAMGSLHGEMSWEDFLPSLSYVIVECNRPHILIEVEYMMELLEPSWLGGEGGYYLTSVYASLGLIQSLDREQPFSGCLTPEAQEALKEWSSRRSREAQRQKENQQSQVGARCCCLLSLEAQHRLTCSVIACVGLHINLLYSCHTGTLMFLC
uniref:Si:ch211-168d1.3 n=1 Tax=Cyclopterus lumpus TaxID=8103 RepID=A0A8C3G1K1_CYCLU